MSIIKKTLEKPHSVEKEIERFVQDFQKKSHAAKKVEFDTLSINSVPDIRRLKLGKDYLETSSVSTTGDISDDSSYVEIMSQSESSDSVNLRSSPRVFLKQSLRVPVSRLLHELHRIDYMMGDRVYKYSVLDVAPLLQARYAFISGGKAKDGAPIITFPDNPNHNEPSESDYRQIIEYLSNIPTLVETELGFMIVVDRRQNAWSSVKSLLQNVSNYFPYTVNCVLLLKPTGFFQRAFSDYRSKFKDDFTFQVTVCEKPTDLHAYIEASQLTTDLGGEIEYDHNEWIEIRSAIEKFGKNAQHISQTLEYLATRYWEMEFPNDIEHTERVIREHILERKAMIEDLTSATHHGGSLLACVKGDNPEPPLGKRVHVETLERLLLQLDETQKAFEEFWIRHETKLKQCLQLRQFEDEFKLIQYSADRHIDWLSGKMDLLGDSLVQVDQLLSEFTDFKEQAEKDVEKAERLHRTGSDLMEENHYAVDSIRPKCVELQRMCDQYRQLLRRRQEILTRSRDLQDRIEKANKWCTHGVDLLATQQLERFNTEKGAERALQDLEQFMDTAQELKLSNPKEFRNLFESLFTPETKSRVQSLLQRFEDVQAMCEKRKNSLRRLSAAQRPVVPVNPEPVVTYCGDSINPPAVYTPEPERKNYSRMSRKNKLSVKGKFGRRVSNNCNEGNNNNNIEADSYKLSLSLGDIDDVENTQCKQRQILSEMIDTEKLYVSELYDILRGYYSELDNPQIQHIVPTALIGQRETLFGNIEAIYRFHNETFLDELQTCWDDPASVGMCFIDRREDFKLYSTYCQNKPKSEALRNQIKDDNPFFKECQRKLGHKLPLSAYLLKPVQRITKYQLLLKEMLKCSDDEDTSSADLLHEALDVMLDLLKHVNDLMHQVAITGFTGNLMGQGRLLMQGSFHVWCERKKDKMRDFRFKAQQRHIFLYEKAILLCKKKEEGHSYDRAQYAFKNYLMTSQIGLTETVKGDKKFEIFLRGREEVYTLQASSVEEKEEWCREIKKVLMSQFDLLQAENKKSLTASKSQENLSTCKFSETSSDSGYGRDSWTSSLINTINAPSGGIVKSLSNNSSHLSIDDDVGWSSSEFSNGSEEESGNNGSALENVFVPNYRQHFVSVSEYTPIEENEVHLAPYEHVEVLRVAAGGWWFVGLLSSGARGWVPGSYLEPVAPSSKITRSMENLTTNARDGYISSNETTV